MDNRRHPRVNISLPIRFVVEQPETRDSQDGQGMLKNISYGGILFLVEPPLPVQPGHVREFSFFLSPDNNKQCEPSHFQAQGLVLRIDPPHPNSSAYGVAVQFLSALTMEDVTVKMTISSRRRVDPRAKPIKGKR
jgi:hypothetical protein